MANHQLRVLYLSNAFPPGVSGRFPGLCASSHPQETRMIHALSQLVEISSVGLLPGRLWGHLEPADRSLGLKHKLLLWERKPEPWHRWRSLQKLCAFYSEEVKRDGVPDVLLVRNLSNVVYNYFTRWLRRQPRRPIIVTVLADSGLGQPVSILRRLRYKIKPMQVLEETALPWYDACLGFGINSRCHFEPRGVPWMWMPAAYNFYFEPPPPISVEGPIQFGYFGGLIEATGVLSMVRAFLTAGVPGSLRICGFGQLTETIKQLAAKHPNLVFDGVKSQTECLDWAQQIDVLVNPRLPFAGWDNSFPSKLFEYGMTGKAILSTRACGVDQVLQAAGLYIDDCANLEDSLLQQFQVVSAMSRDELRQRGSVIRQRIVNEFNWDVQARRIVAFVEELIKSGRFLSVRG
jgi:glycosyltransferase involved in cell wall biosynthesis